MNVLRQRITRPYRVLITQKFASLGGSQKSLVHHLELLDRERYEPHLLLADRGWLTAEMDRLQVPWSLMRFGHWTNLLSLPRNLVLVRRMTSYVAAHGIDLIHANEHWVGPPSYWTARRSGIPSVCHFRTGLNDLTPTRVRKYLYDRFDRVLVVAEVLKNALVPHLKHPERVVVVRDGVEPFTEPLAYHHGRKTRVVLSVGVISNVKGQAIILDRALPWLKSSRKHFLVFVGRTDHNPVYVRQMLECVAKKKLQRQVLFFGSRKDVPRLLLASDVLVAYSTVEGIPRVVMEAMFAGRPVIVSSTPGMSEVVADGRVGQVLNFDDTACKLSQSLAELDSNYPRWESMGRQAREQAASRYSTRAMSDAIQEVYSALLEPTAYG
jgi:glycosyltransferase involved in cell wall biosynthesis